MLKIKLSKGGIKSVFREKLDRTAMKIRIPRKKEQQGLGTMRNMTMGRGTKNSTRILRLDAHTDHLVLPP